MDIIETIEYKGGKIEIALDCDMDNPRTSWDHTAVMVCWHRRYNLGDIQPSDDPQEFLQSLSRKERRNAKPLYLYDHSGLTISLGSFSCPWDSGQVGFIYIPDSVERWKGFKYSSIYESEVSEYDSYLRGEGYGFIATLGGREDSCWGFLGGEGKETSIQEAKAAIDYWIEQESKAECFEQSCFAY